MNFPNITKNLDTYGSSLKIIVRNHKRSHKISKFANPAGKLLAILSAVDTAEFDRSVKNLE